VRKFLNIAPQSGNNNERELEEDRKRNIDTLQKNIDTLQYNTTNANN